MAATIEQLVTELKTNYSPEDIVNVDSRVLEHLTVYMNNGDSSFTHCGSIDGKWDCLCLRSGTSKVAELLKTLQTYLPEHKDKSFCTFSTQWNRFELASYGTKSAKMCNIDFNKTIKDMGQVKQLLIGETWKKFEVELAKFKESTSNNAAASSSRPSLLQAAQVLLVSYPELGSILCVEDVFYRTWSDVQKQYPELTETDEKDLFFFDCGVKVSSKTDVELKNFCQIRKSPKYVTDDGTFTREELLKQYSFPETVIDKLFVLDGNVMKCKSGDILSAFKI